MNQPNHIIEILIYTLPLLVLAPISKGQNIQVDHVISVVADIEEVIQNYEEKGFTVKRGTLHPNGLLNAHIKFNNHTSFELMSLKEEPKDEMAREYEALLKEGEGGVYVALSGVRIDSMSMVLSELGIEHNSLSGENWNYITFPKTSPHSHFFFIEYHAIMNDPGDVLIHENGSTKMNKVYVQGDKDVLNFLNSIGSRSLRKIDISQWGSGIEFPTKTGSIIIVPWEEQNKGPRIKSISFGRNDNTESFLLIFD
jgi:hypothetical protein